MSKIKVSELFYSLQGEGMINNDILKWTATFVALAGATATALQLTPINLYILNIASVIFLLWGIRINDKAIICVNIGMLAIYGFGVFI